MDCDTCHGISAPEAVQSAIANSQTNCDACHTVHADVAAFHQSITDLAGSMNMVNCSWCHSSTEPAYANNNLIGVHIKPGINLTQQYDCNVCHSPLAPVSAQVANKQTTCEACHNGISAPTAHPDNQYYPRHTVSRFPVFMPEYNPQCSTCHTDNSVINLHAAKNVGCKTCHFTEAYKPAVFSLDANCTGYHTAAVNPAMDMVSAHKTFHNTDTTKYPETAECLSCHAKDSTVDGQSLLGMHKKDSGSTVTCDTCHGSTARQAVKDAITANNVSCLACHNMVPRRGSARNQ